MIRSSARRAGLAALLCALLTPGPAAAAGDVLVFAAASLKNAVDEIAAQYAADTGITMKAAYAGSAALARQIEQGAPADIFISADLDWMDYLAGKGLIRPASRSNLLGNRLALIAAADSRLEVEVAPGMPLGELLGSGRLAVADTDAVPAGRYAKAALTALGVWDAVADRLARAENVRAALALVARGEAPLGIVYRTDAAAEPDVRIVADFPEESHPPIVYPIALLEDAPSPDAAAALTYLRSPSAKAIYERHGFTVLE